MIRPLSGTIPPRCPRGLIVDVVLVVVLVAMMPAASRRGTLGDDGNTEILTDAAEDDSRARVTRWSGETFASGASAETHYFCLALSFSPVYCARL
jgi:hypothetical protein